MIKEDHGVKAKPSTVRNPQTNAIVERVHQVIGNIIRTFELENNYT
jgi:transposase InsO family protein